MFNKEDYPPTRFPSSSFVPPEGPIGAPIMVIGEAPGYHEDVGIELEDGTRIHRPFCGASGRMLDGLLRQAGLKREEIFITNVIKRMPNNKNDITTKDAQIEVANNINALRKEIRAVKPRVIVPVGNTALQALGIRWKIGNCRGFIINTPYGKVIPTYHPAFVFRQYQEKVTCQKDWQKIARQSKTVSYPVFREEFELEPTIEDVERFAMLVQRKVESGQKVSIALDLETYYLEGSPLNNPIKLVGMAFDSSHAIVIPFIDQNNELYWKTEDEEIRAWVAIGSILENPRLEIMAHNMMFDIVVLKNHGLDVRAKLYDTIIAQSLVYFPSKHSLEYLASVYTDYPPWKLLQTKSDEGFRYYNAKDCVVLHEIRPSLDEDIKADGLTIICGIMMNVILPTVDMMLRGIAIDTKAYNDIKESLEEKIEDITRELRGHAGNVSFNPNATQQVSNLLFKQLKLRSGVKTKGGAKSTSEDVLNRLSLRYPKNEVVKLMQEYRHYSQQYKTFIKNLYIHTDNRVHSEFKLHRVATGRYSSSNPNIQNLPARKDEDGFIRGLYRVPPGRMLVSADYSQLELMIFAELADDEIWKEAFKQGLDVHEINSRALLREYHDKKYRTFVKNFIYGLVYGSEGGEVERVAPKELIEHISVPQMMENLKEEHPALFTYRSEIEDQLNRRRWIANAFGRRRYWPTMSLTKANYREAYNYPIQGTAADIMHTRTPLIVEALHSDQDWLVLQLHDAFYVETDESRIDTVARTLATIMGQPIETPMGHTFNLRADVEYGVSLAKKDMQEWKST